MIHRVEIQNQIDAVTHVTHCFEEFVNSEEESRDFGKKACQISFAFDAGFGEGLSDGNESE